MTSPMRDRYVLIIDRSQLLMVLALQAQAPQRGALLSWCPISRIVCLSLIIHNALWKKETMLSVQEDFGKMLQFNKLRKLAT